MPNFKRKHVFLSVQEMNRNYLFHNEVNLDCVWILHSYLVMAE